MKEYESAVAPSRDGRLAREECSRVHNLGRAGLSPERSLRSLA